MKKPVHGVARDQRILARIEAKGYALVDIRLVEPDRDVLAKHYEEHLGKPFTSRSRVHDVGPVGRDPLAGNRVIEASASRRHH
ncbi:nucleoside-diphosphate kinase [Microbacterium sp.]|uniref:nucleoside-diphosphate kinase n=1 Tax=Microbacterium sp. TaxID=51671 RepID=UPI003A8E2C06